jgi:hypothetical protein
LRAYLISSQFVADLVAAGEQGGRQASRLLKTYVLKHLQDILPPSTKIVIRVYANLIGLSKAYREAGFLQTNAVFEAFVNGFNKEDALCDFVNAGDGKECADEKIKGEHEITTGKPCNTDRIPKLLFRWA